MRNEIGSEFWDVPLSRQKNGLFDNVAWFISGRAALRSILRQIPLDFGISRMRAALPSFLCESMLQPFELENVEYKFYDVRASRNGLSCDYANIADCNVVLVIDYFGYESLSNEIPKGKIIIRDLTHSMFVKKYNDADYYFGSLRKWAGFVGAGFAYKKRGEIAESFFVNEHYAHLRKKAMSLKEKYITNISDSKDYLGVFREAESLLDDCDVSMCEKSDVEKAAFLDVDFIKDSRRKNAKILIDMLRKYSLFKEIKENDCPLCVPIMCDKRDQLRDFLIAHNIFCPIHWPEPKCLNGASTEGIYKKELSLVCDQRYTEEDMRTIAKAVLLFLEGDSNA